MSPAGLGDEGLDAGADFIDAFVDAGIEQFQAASVFDQGDLKLGGLGDQGRVWAL